MALLILAAALGSGASQAEEFAIAGAGTLSCEKYLEGRNGKDRILEMAVITWVQGYLSGVNSTRYMDSGTEMSILPSSDAITAYAAKFCTDNPSKTLYEAAIPLGKAL